MGTPKATRLSGRVVFLLDLSIVELQKCARPAQYFGLFFVLKTTRLIGALIKNNKIYILFCIDERYVKAVFPKTTEKK